MTPNERCWACGLYTDACNCEVCLHRRECLCGEDEGSIDDED